jgi:hypothetical protein
MALGYINGYSIVVAVTASAGTLAGDLTLQLSNNAFLDNVNNNANTSATWITVTDSTKAISTTTTASTYWNIPDANYSAYRIVWTRSGGSGAYTAYHYAKGPL